MRFASTGKKIVRGTEDLHSVDDREEDRWTCRIYLWCETEREGSVALLPAWEGALCI